MIRSLCMAWNVFKLCKGLRVIGSLMIFAVLAIVGLTYYSLVILNYGPKLLKGGKGLAVALPILIIFHLLLVMILWCYFVTVFTDPGSVPEHWRPALEEEGLEAHSGPLSEAPTLNGATTSSDAASVNGSVQSQNVRYCRRCSHYKPPRTHHCSVCGRCVLKMDHHCVWVATCVGALNYKFFLLFLLYTFLGTLLSTLSLLPPFIDYFKDIGQHSNSAINLAMTFLAFVLNVAFVLSLLGFIILHASLVFSNTTTIEAHEKKTSVRWRYDMGVRQNFEQVFGASKLFWVIPAYSQRDVQNMPVLQGFNYPVRPAFEEQYF
ncbi:hypothetical protein KP509_30G029900 [Ceratopteris richardii]|uniref:S-acyltransferase n=1 Tax=Ceratopteris richardii TaxID=49495 RepID=A0A8T2R2U1_CERRI|nr:hypothetical protein KP509_30G029900 [Ceratopteris richardii]KAH7290040.1 hypothetical protein KP509_30G029900 [Ceratopteris richardii]KAH7290041.1 hypothetical protein KP509_30G029900 [Ceratopteris richardii]